MIRSILLAITLLFLALPAYAQETPDVVRKRVLCDLDENGFATTVGDYGVFIAAFQAGGPAITKGARASDFNNDGSVTTIDWGLMLAACPLNE